MANTISKHGNGKQGATKEAEREERSNPTGLAERRPSMPGHYGGFEPLRQLRTEFDRLFDHFFAGWSTLRGEWDNGWRLDVDDQDEKVVVRAEAPGFEPGDFDVQVRESELVLQARKESRSDEGDSHEWAQRQMYRTVSLPRGVDPEHVEAQYRNGVLTVMIPKTEKSQRRHIEVKG